MSQTQSQLSNDTSKPYAAFEGYETKGFYDELVAPDGRPRPFAERLCDLLSALPEGELARRKGAADLALLHQGITFTVYGEEGGTERIFPFDLIPRIIAAEEWSHIEAGLKQRITALNMFVHDVYNDAECLKEGIVPEALIRGASTYRKQCEGIKPPNSVWAHITGTDLVRDGEGVMHVLEDNLRCPSGVSYVLENRQVMKQTFPQMFADMRVRPVFDYPYRLLEMLQAMAPSHVSNPKIAVLTPGMYNSAYFEHSFLAQQMGVELVEGRDLVVKDDRLYMRTTKGFERIDVLYRRLDDDFLDPCEFREDSMLGVPGLMGAFRAGGVALANAPGTGIADDKVVYAYVPRIIEYFLNEKPILPNVPTYLCWRKEDRKYVLEHLAELVVKPADESGGYGMLVGPHATKEEIEKFHGLIEKNPRKYIAQPTLNLSRMPTMIEDHLEGRHIDLRPFILSSGDKIYVMPGGLTRVALRKGSLVVNSSQGGGSKDTWALC